MSKLDTLKPYVGGDAALKGDDQAIRLMSNEGPLGPSPQAIRAATITATKVTMYPDSGCKALRETLASMHEIEADQVVCGNGSDDLINILCQAYLSPGDNIVYSEHGFLMYPIAAKGLGAEAIAAPENNCTTDIDAILAAVTTKTKLVFIANPNNPTGTCLPFSMIRTLREKLADDVILVLDGAYAECVIMDDYNAGIDLVKETNNTVMLRTFSKLYALAGMRIGWAYASPEITEALNKIRMPFNVNAIAQASAIATLEDNGHTQKAIAHNTYYRAWLTKECEALGYKVYPSEANFILVDAGGACEAVYNHLKDHHIYVRNVSSYGLPTCLRISIGTAEELEALVACLKTFTTG